MALVVKLNGLLGGGGFYVGSRGDGLEDQAIYGGTYENFAHEAWHYELNIMKYDIGIGVPPHDRAWSSTSTGSMC
jgi:hypothetical protein